ncbi:hypothetical protein [Lishizhenia sp.]|uniref:hypothetical protein n=1 Tax=Lishizhenia sp. TaxID=2497594 RepID=UPI00299D8EB8|nr:hypothetical protein [Lishizhenia sp.]MDX1444837.1 hypothetical protein [Lishizhenia sp.]
MLRTKDVNANKIREILEEQDSSSKYKVKVISIVEYPGEYLAEEKEVAYYKISSKKEDVYLTIDTVNNCTTDVQTYSPDGTYNYSSNSEIENILLEEFNFCGDTLSN